MWLEPGKRMVGGGVGETVSVAREQWRRGRAGGTAQALDVALTLSEMGADGGIAEEEHDLISNCLIP